MSVGVKFHSSKLSPEQVKLFRRIEREKVNKQLDGYVHQCLRMKVLFWFFLKFHIYCVNVSYSCTFILLQVVLACS
jgi:hypothetical protein